MESEMSLFRRRKPPQDHWALPQVGNQGILFAVSEKSRKELPLRVFSVEAPDFPSRPIANEQYPAVNRHRLGLITKFLPPQLPYWFRCHATIWFQGPAIKVVQRPRWPVADVSLPSNKTSLQNCSPRASAKTGCSLLGPYHVSPVFAIRHQASQLYLTASPRRTKADLRSPRV